MATHKSSKAANRVRSVVNRERSEDTRHFRSLSRARQADVAKEILSEIVEREANNWALIAAVTARLRGMPAETRDEPSLAICLAFEELAGDLSQHYRLQTLIDVMASGDGGTVAQL